jgi:hypothetical protein
MHPCMHGNVEHTKEQVTSIASIFQYGRRDQEIIIKLIIIYCINNSIVIY